MNIPLSSTSTQSPNLRDTVVQRWQDAGSRLSGALQSYLDSYLLLETTLSQGDGASIDLIPQVDSTLNLLSRSRSTLAQARNRKASRLCALPDEILAGIFLEIIFVQTEEERMTGLDMEQTLQIIHRHLHILNSICTAWRNVIINCKTAWHIVPFINREHKLGAKPLATDLSLHRAGSRLHLAAILLHGWDTLNDSKALAAKLTEHAHRFSTANIGVRFQADLTVIIEAFLESKHPLALSELSLYQNSTRPSDDLGDQILEPVFNIPKGHQYIFPKDSPSQRSFGDMLEFLSALRLSGVLVHWDMIKFSAHLTVLHLYRVSLGYDSCLTNFLQAASSASELRDLKIISVLSCCNDSVPQPAVSLNLSFPKLQSLFLGDLDLYVLDVILRSIARGSHRLSLLLTYNSITRYDEGKQKEYNIDDLCRLLTRSTVDTLLLDGKRGWGPPLDVEELWRLLNAIPHLKTLKLVNWTFNTADWNALARPTPSLTNLEELHLNQAEFVDADGIKRVLETISIRKIVIGACVREGTAAGVGSDSDRGHLGDPLLQDVRPDIVEWLRFVVPDVHLNTAIYYPREFRQLSWKLW